MRSTLLIPSALICSVAFAQPQLENSSFEDWVDIGEATEEPAQWSSVKTSDGGTLINNFAPQLCWQSVDARTGAFSTNLRTVTSVVGAASGLLTNGRVHAEFTVANSYVFTDLAEPDWNTPCSSRPDSLIGWFKAAPEAGDFAKVECLLHVEEGRLPAFGTEANRVGYGSWSGPDTPVTEWTRFSVPIVYDDERIPEHVLFVLASGNGTSSIIGTEAWFDDLGLIYNVSCTPSEPIAFVNATAGFDLFVDFSTGGVPESETDFVVELSDVNGDFTDATVVGSLTTSLSEGSISCTIPAGTLPGADYQVRVVNASPFYVPVPSGIIVEINTSVSEALSENVLVSSFDGQVFVDLRGAEFGNTEYGIFDIRGAQISSGSLQAGDLYPIPVEDVHGILVVRLLHANGSVVQRVLVP